MERIEGGANGVLWMALASTLASVEPNIRLQRDPKQDLVNNIFITAA